MTNVTLDPTSVTLDPKASGAATCVDCHKAPAAPVQFTGEIRLCPQCKELRRFCTSGDEVIRYVIPAASEEVLLIMVQREKRKTVHYAIVRRLQKLGYHPV